MRMDVPVSGPTRELIDLCTAVAGGERQREADLDRLRRTRHQELTQAWEMFAQSVETRGEDFVQANRTVIEQVEAQFLAYSQCLDRISSFVMSRKPELLTQAAAILARTSPALLQAQSAYETAVLTIGRSRFPMVNLFENLARGLREGRFPVERWQIACRSHQEFYRKVVEEIDASPQAAAPGVPERRAASASLLALLENLERLAPHSSSTEFDGLLERMLILQTEMEEAVETFNFHALSATPTASAEANRVLHAADALRNGLVAADVLHGLAAAMQETVRGSIAEVQAASHLPAEAPVVAEQIPLVLASLQDIDAALTLLCKAKGAGADLDRAAAQLEEAVGRLDAASRVVSQHNETYGKALCIHCQHFNPPTSRVCEACERPLPRFEGGEPEAASGFVEGGAAAGSRQMIITVSMKELQDACHALADGRVSEQELFGLLALNVEKIRNVEAEASALVLPEIPDEATEEEREKAEEFLDLGRDALTLLSQGVEECMAGLQQLEKYARGRQSTDMQEGLRRFFEGVQKLFQIERVADAFVAALPRSLEEEDGTEFASADPGQSPTTYAPEGDDDEEPPTFVTM